MKTLPLTTTSAAFRLGRNRGFTIIELLVAVAVTVLLVSMMLGIVTNITSGWNRSSGSLESGNQARLVLDQMAGDLQAAILRRDGGYKDASGNDHYNVWFAASVETTGVGWTQGGTNTFDSQTNLEKCRFGPYGVWLRFFSTVPGTNEAGKLNTLSAPRAVAYQIKRLPIVDKSKEIRYQMFRSEVAPDLTFGIGYNLKDSKYGSGGGVGSQEIRAPLLNSVIANNVVDFGVRIYEGGVLKFPLSASASFSSTTDPAIPAADKGYPDSVEIFVRILSTEGAQQLSLLENHDPDDPNPVALTAEKWWGIVEANSRVYTRRVDLKAKSL